MVSRRRCQVCSNGQNGALANQATKVERLVKCTVQGCDRTFKHSQALDQHLNSKIHRERQKSKTIKSCVGTSTTSKVGVAVQNPNEKEKKIERRVASETSRTTGIEPLTSMLEATNLKDSLSDSTPKAESMKLSNKQARILHHLEERLKRSRDVVGSSSAAIAPKNVAVFGAREAPQLHLRWSTIPRTQHASALATLKSHSRSSTLLSKCRQTKKFATANVLETPVHNPRASKKSAVALDCEMVRIGHNVSELARLSVIDYLTEEILLDDLVLPVHTVTDWRTEWSDITAEVMNHAVASGTALKGSVEARSRLFELIDERTVVVGHALQFDLAALGIHHENVVDSAFLAKKAVGMGARKEWGLKTLCQELLGLTVQNHDKEGHDSVEDALAAREVVLWCLRNRKDLKEWGKRKRKDILEEDRARKARQNARQQRENVRRVPRYEYCPSDDDDDSETMTFEDLAEMCGWPEGYEPGSD